MTADQILAAKHYSQIFKDKSRLKQDYLNLCKVYHPDLHKSNPLANEIMTKINVLYEAAQHKKETLIVSGKEYYSLYQTKTLIICAEHVLITTDEPDKYLNLPLTYTSEAMKKEFSRYFPQILDHDQHYVVVQGNNLYSLKEIHERGPMEPVHLAWLMNRLFSICLYFDVIKCSHCALTMDNILFSPQLHTAYILGGWEHIYSYSQPVKSMDKSIYDSMPYSVKNGGRDHSSINIRSVLGLGKQLLANESHPLFSVLNTEQTQTNQIFDQWNQTLNNIFGKRKFIEYFFTR